MDATNTWTDIIKKYFSNTISDEELNQLLIMTEEHYDPEALITALKDRWEDSKEMHEERKLYWDDRFATMMEETRHLKCFEEMPVAKKIKRMYRAIAAAAAIVILLFGSAYLILGTESNHSTTKVIDKANHNDILPGGNKAILTLSNGTNILLDSSANGMLALQGNTRIVKVSNGTLVYTPNPDTKNSVEVQFNTINTPRGGQYKLVLPDGSLVWLNSASSIHFPTAFIGRERKVEITGEAYFEVAKNKDMPFKVKSTSSEIEVLGTHFNVNAYDDESSVKTTLLEGMVKVSGMEPGAKQLPKFLQPGQQAVIDKQGTIIVMDNADIEEAIAWKNGLFQFKSADLKAILRQIARWYDVEVVYVGNVNLHFTGQLTRNENVSSLFEKLALTGEVHFKIDGKKIIVSP